MKQALSLLAIAPLLVLLAGCAMPVQKSPVIATPEYAERPSVATSLFPSDQAVLGDDAIARILGSKLELPRQAKVALMKFPDSGRWGSRHYGHLYWADEEYLKLQQDYLATLTGALLQSNQIQEVTPLPSLMTPHDIAIPVLREAAVRLQADLLLVFRISSDTYSKYRTLAKDKVKAYATCELVLLDIRTGLVPFTRVITKERQDQKAGTDLDLSETMRRAESAAAAEALRTAADELVQFIKSVPKKSG